MIGYLPLNLAHDSRDNHALQEIHLLLFRTFLISKKAGMKENVIKAFERVRKILCNCSLPMRLLSPVRE